MIIPTQLGFILVLLFAPLGAIAQVSISEFMAANSRTLADEDGEFPDWIELFNESNASVNLDGWFLSDAADEPAKWRLPAITLPPRAFLVVFASAKNRANPAGRLHTNFSLDADGEYLALVKPDGSTIASEFAPQFPAQRQDISYGTGQALRTNTLLPSGAAARFLAPVSSALGVSWITASFNDTSWTSGVTGVGYESSVAGIAVRNVKANVLVDSLTAAKSVLADPSKHLRVAAENAPFVNYFNTGGEGHYANNRNFPGAVPGADEEDFVVEATGTLTLTSGGAWTFGVNSDDGFELAIGGFTLSFPNPRGPTDTLGVFNAPAAGDYEFKLVYYERGGGAGLEWFAAKGSFAAWDQTAFRLVGDLASGGIAARSAPVSGGSSTATSSFRSAIKSDVLAAMKGRNPSLFLRVPFQITDVSAVRALTLRAQYDDGFVAYLNGQEIARRNAPAALDWNSAAASVRPQSLAVGFEEIPLSDRLGLLRTGANLLAIHGLNASANDDDFLILPELVEQQIDAIALRYFVTPSPGTPNGGGTFAFVSDTKFSHDRGFYTAPFNLQIRSDTTNAVIRYTTNGTPPSLTNGFVYSTPLPIQGTTVLRAAAFKEGYEPSNVDTHTYLFLDDVIRQSPTGQPPAGWPSSWGSNTRDYGMDPDVVNNALYSGTIKADLQTIPSFCVVTDLKHLFDPTTGIYANPGQDGAAWERPCSLELVHADGAKGFQINAGIRIRGGFSRSTSNPKHAFRFFFREEYGATKLKHPLFEDGGTDTFNAFDLRTFQNYSWSFQGDSRGHFIRDQFNRDTQLAMGHQAERGNYYHLYINGQYWGLFNTCERPEASFGETYYGGNKDDYDVIKVEAGSYTINATDGDLAAWTRLYNAAKAGFAADEAYERVQGNNADSTPNSAYENLVDVPNLIDYMLIILYGGNLDAPISNFLGNTSPNNWYGLRNRRGVSGGFKYFVHDAEHTLLDLNQDRTGPYTAGDSSITKSNPQWIWQKLQANAEFKLRVADHVHRHFFNGGALTPEACRARFIARRDEIDRAVVGESARWGDAKVTTPFTRHQHWLTAVNNALNNHIPQRSTVVLNQLKADGLYPATAAPSFSQHGGNVPLNYALGMSAPTGVIYYTLDGSDPRLRGGTVSSRALTYGSPLTLRESVRVKSRVRTGAGWSALSEAEFTVIQTYNELRITEIMYQPPSFNNADGDDFEFIELKNISARELDLSGVRFTNGVRYVFPLGTRLPAGQFVVLASNPIALASKYPGLRVFGAYEGRLANGGERVTLTHASGGLLSLVDYGDQAPWPALANGQGFSLVPTNPNAIVDANHPSQWRASSKLAGSPGAADAPANVHSILITEINTHTDSPQLDSIELFNPNPIVVDISNWHLSDDLNVPKKYRIPAGTVIGPAGYRVFNETHFNPIPGVDPSFSLDSHGDSVHLFSADAAGNLTGFSDGFSFGAAANGVSFGRYTSSDGQVHYPAQSVLTLGTPNSAPRVGPVVINEIHYQPLPSGDEFIELKNISGTTVKLFDPVHPTNRWSLEGVDFEFPPNGEIAPNSLLLLVGTDPATFRARYGVPASVPIYGPFSGNLQDNGETLRLHRPDAPDRVTNGSLITVVVPRISIDEVRYDDQSPWPAAPAGKGPSLERITATAFGNDPANWRASFNSPSPGIENSGNRAPTVNAGIDLALKATAFPASTNLTATVSDDGQPNPPGRTTTAWTQVSGPTAATIASPTQLATPIQFTVAGSYVFQMSASDGTLTASDTVTITVEKEPLQQTIIAPGATWKYLDTGTDPGASWNTSAYNDSAWKSGLAQLGYGDGGEATVVGFGPSSAAKYIATYFRRVVAIANPKDVKRLLVKLLRDDGGVVYINGKEVFRSNMPEGNITAATRASAVVGVPEESAFFEREVDPALLVAGNNLLAVEIHQSGPDSSDISFDFEMIAFVEPAAAENKPPGVTAGADLTIRLPNPAGLNGTASDDGQPTPPGRLTLLWSRVSGPGTVTFDNPAAASTSVQFSAAGVYVLRLAANDGAFNVTDDLTVSVEQDDFAAWKSAYFTASELANPQLGGDHADPDLDRRTNYEEYLSGTHPKNLLSVLKVDSLAPGKAGAVLRFQAMPGKSYTIQVRVAAQGGFWQKLADIPAESSSRPVDIVDPAALGSTARFYRVITPTQ